MNVQEKRKIMMLRMPGTLEDAESLWKKIKAAAALDGVAIGEWIIKAAEEKLNTTPFTLGPISRSENKLPSGT